MTIKSLFNWGGFGGELEKPHIPNERWHRDGWEHKYHGHGHSTKGGGKGNAVLSALALLAFLFFINIMQQSLNDNNSTVPTGTTTALLIREDSSPIILTSRDNEMISKSKKKRSMGDDGIIFQSDEISNEIVKKNQKT